MCLISAIAGLGTAWAITEAVVVGAVGAAVGGIVSTVGAVQQAKTAQAQAQYQADMAKENARIASRQAENIDLQANQERNQLRLRMLAQKGDARTGYASQGVVLGSGSSADYEADIADAYDLDTKNLEYDIANRKWQMKVQAANYENQSAMYSSQADAYGRQAGTSLLSGAFGTIGSTLGAAVSTGMTASRITKTSFGSGLFGKAV